MFTYTLLVFYKVRSSSITCCFTSFWVSSLKTNAVIVPYNHMIEKPQVDFGQSWGLNWWFKFSKQVNALSMLSVPETNLCLFNHEVAKKYKYYIPYILSASRTQDHTTCEPLLLMWLISSSLGSHIYMSTIIQIHGPRTEVLTEGNDIWES